MSAAIVESIIRKSVIDEEFRQLLLNNPAEALAGYELTDDERARLHKLDGTLFNMSSSNLEIRVSRATLERGGWDGN